VKVVAHSIIYNGETCNELIQRLIDAAIRITNVEKLTGTFIIDNNIPIGAGLGSSAAVCANLAKLFKHFGFCDDIIELATNLEDVFHQNSSGVDPAVAVFNRPIVFQNRKVMEVLNIPSWPHLMLSYSGKSSSTSECVKIVNDIFTSNIYNAIELDAQMNEAANLCEIGLKTSDFTALKEGMELGYKVFCGWGLCTPQLKSHIDLLLSNGAMAAKPTGSGLGGFVVSLWKEKPQPLNDNDNMCLTLNRP
jgi:mevalonate kinase